MFSHPPLSQIPHGSVLFAFVKEPFSFSKAQKKRVLFGWPCLSTGMLPAKLRPPRGNVTFGRASVTSKSIHDLNASRLNEKQKSLTGLPLRAEIAAWLARIVVRPRTSDLAGGEPREREKRVNETLHVRRTAKSRCPRSPLRAGLYTQSLTR